MDEHRFEHLLSCLLDEELTADELSELCRLARGRPDRQAELQSQLEAAGWIAQAQDELRDSRFFVAATLDRIGGDPFVASVRSAIVEERKRPRRVPKWIGRWTAWAVAAAFVAIIASVAVLRPREEPKVVWITALNGPVQWTGDGGRVGSDLGIGSSLSGGTLESLSAESWAVLDFRDDSTVTVSGLSMLTIAGGARKELHLRRGSLSVRVGRQHVGERMVIYTPTAKLELLGTQLNVEASSSSTMLNVNEGRVRITRLVDGRITEVPADHRIVASLDSLGEYEARPQPEPVQFWRGELPKDAKYGRWLSAQAGAGDSLHATPYLVTCGRPKPLLVYLTAFSVASSESPPVRPGLGNRFRVRGWLKSTGEVYFGLTMQYPRGGFAGKYIASRKVVVSEQNGGLFNLDFGLEEFHPEENKFPATPLGLELFDCWCLTLHKDIGLAIERVELIPATP